MKKIHAHAEGTLIRVVKDLSGEAPEVVGFEGRVEALLPRKPRQPLKYKILVFGRDGVPGGLFEVEEEVLRLLKDLSAFIRCALSVAVFPNKPRYVYRTTTRFSRKSAEGHNAGCVMYAPRHKCICMKIEAEAENTTI